MAVVAGYDKAREVLSVAGLHRVLRVAPTLPGAELRNRGCRPEHGASRNGNPAAGAARRPLGPYADTSRPRFPGER
ncbi:hypothetical protein [Streptomyces sp. MNU77]|uniref:hypothetical protein n=1 Tax=Streptomyces sp. MNU77 TaxID=1573406 RepID=UPI00211625DA|nr:hypothetical protein [Streptomyces sp. MNU77]